MIPPPDVGRLLGYARVSTDDQDLSLQIDALARHGIPKVRIYMDKLSGARSDRPGLAKCLDALQHGDILVVWRLDRLGRSMRHLITLVEDLRERGIGFRSLNEGAIDTTSASGELIFNIFSALAQFEHRLIQERTKAGLAAARARGRRGGRPRLESQQAKVRAAKKLSADKSITSILMRTIPGSHAPWDVVSWQPCIHLVLFVHRVMELQSGVYAFVRDHTKLDVLKRVMQSDFAWQLPAGVDSDCPLYLLREAEFQNAARTLSCHQDIASSDGFFSLGMLAEFAQPIRRHGACFYRHLFWEAGVIGQVLYLEAEAASARSTGIGCFFDDAVHDELGLTDNQFQSLYHFTVGIPVEDHRLQSWPAYPEERE